MTISKLVRLDRNKRKGLYRARALDRTGIHANVRQLNTRGSQARKAMAFRMKLDRKQPGTKGIPGYGK